MYIFAVHPLRVKFQFSVTNGLAMSLDALTSLFVLLAAGFACTMFFTLWRDIDGESRKQMTGKHAYAYLQFVLF